MANTKDVPVFGMLSGLKVFSTGSVVAAPFAASLFAENGATVIHAESTMAPDVIRGGAGWGWVQEHRNEIVIAMNIPSPEGKELFFKFVKWADIWVESAKGGTYAKWGLTDEVIWEQNPKLTIVHVSGFGQEGIPEYVERASYDAVGQAFGGYIWLNGMPYPQPPMRAVPYTCDYVTALNAAWAGLAGYINAQKTGKGESIDLAQFELMAKIQLGFPLTYFQEGTLIKRNGNEDPTAAGYSVYECGDGNYVFLGMVGPSVLKRGVKLLGLEGDPDFPPGLPGAMKPSAAADKLEQAIKDFCLKYPAMEVEKIMAENTVPCSTIFNLTMMEKDPHYAAREVFAEWEDPAKGKVKGINVMPRVKRNKNKIWRGAPLYGADNVDVLKEFGYDDAQIKDLYEKGVIKGGK